MMMVVLLRHMRNLKSMILLTIIDLIKIRKNIVAMCAKQ